MRLEIRLPVNPLVTKYSLVSHSLPGVQFRYIMIDKFKARLLYCENHSVYEPNNINNINE